MCIRDSAKRGTQSVLFDGFDVVAVVEDLTLLDVVEAVDQVGDGGLTGAGRTDESDLLARTAVEVDVCLLYTSLRHNRLRPV